MPTIEYGEIVQKGRHNLLYQEKSPWIYLNCLFAQVGLSPLDPHASITIDFTEEPARKQRVQDP